MLSIPLSTSNSSSSSSSSKRVHFASTNRIYSPIPSTPSPCASSSSLPSSPDLPATPPELEFYEPGEYDTSAQGSYDGADYGAQYPRSPYPLHSTGSSATLLLMPEPYYSPDITTHADSKEMHVHAHLAYSPYSEPELPYDLSLDIAYVKEQFPPGSLMEPATQPPLSNMTIVCPDFLPWEIHVKPLGQAFGFHPHHHNHLLHYPPLDYITLNDVLTAMYQSLRLPVTPFEYNRLSPSAKQAVDAAYFARISRIVDPQRREKEARKGVKRVDYLGGRNRFGGLSGTLASREVWEVNVS